MDLDWNFYLYSYHFISLAIVVYTILLRLFWITQIKNGFVMDVETHLAGNLYTHKHNIAHQIVLFSLHNRTRSLDENEKQDEIIRPHCIHTKIFASHKNILCKPTIWLNFLTTPVVYCSTDVLTKFWTSLYNVTCDERKFLPRHLAIILLMS